MAGDKVFTMAEVKKHNTATDLWMVIDGLVYDVTKFLGEHPGGKKPLVTVAGKDASKQFHMMHKPKVLVKHGAKFKIGSLAPAARL